LRTDEGFEGEAMTNVKVQSSNENQKFKAEDMQRVIRKSEERIF